MNKQISNEKAIRFINNFIVFCFVNNMALYISLCKYTTSMADIV